MVPEYSVLARRAFPVFRVHSRALGTGASERFEGKIRGKGQARNLMGQWYAGSDKAPPVSVVDEADPCVVMFGTEARPLMVGAEGTR